MQTNDEFDIRLNAYGNADVDYYLAGQGTRYAGRGHSQLVRGVEEDAAQRDLPAAVRLQRAGAQPLIA